MMNNSIRFWTICALLAMVLWPASSVNAQNEEPEGCMTSVRNKINYKIQITDKDIILDHKVLYLEGYQCGIPVYLDSAVVKGGKAVFKSKNPVDKGVYKVIYEPDIHVSVLDIFLQNSNPLKIDLSDLDEEENYACVPELPGRVYANGCISILNDPQVTISLDSFRQIVESYSVAPGSFPEQYFMYNNFLASYLFAKQALPQEPIPQSIFDYVISKFDFSNPLIWNSHSAIHRFLTKYLTDNQIYDTDYLIATMDSLLAVCGKSDPNLSRQVAAFFFNTYLSTGEPAYDPVLLYLYDKYDLPCCLGDRARVAKRKMDVVRKLAPGAQIPELTAYDINGKQHSTNDIKTKYTVLWFWDPDCDHCQEETPILHDIYQKQADELNFEVFAVEVNDDYDRWTAFSEQHQLGDWINLSTSMGETSVDFIEYFDIVTTPVILLIDNENNHTIIARQVTLEELVRKMKNEE